MPTRYRWCSSGTARPEAAGSSSRHTRCRGRAAALCTSSRSAIDWAPGLARACSLPPTGSPANQTAELAHFVDALEQTLDVGGARGRDAFLAGQGIPGVAPEVIERPRQLIHQPVGHQHTDDEDDGEKMDLLADGRLHLHGDVALVHADMHAAGL